MKRMKNIDWADTNTSSRTHIQMFSLTNWMGTIDLSVHGQLWEIVSFFLAANWTEEPLC